MKSQPRIVVTGADGQLGRSLFDVLKNNSNAVFLTKTQLDICDESAVQKILKSLAPQVLINTAAYTNVDAAELDKETAFAVNATGVSTIAKICNEIKCKLIHISTDYVFDGTNQTPYKETDTPNPQTVYGKSKLAGEMAIKESGLQEYAIIRTSWLYSNYGKNFYTTMLRLATEKKEVAVVNDQTGSPTYAPHLAESVLKISQQLNSNTSGVYHFSDAGSITWYEFAKEIFKTNSISTPLKPISSEKFPTTARRPQYSTLNNFKVLKTFDISQHQWTSGIKKCYES